MLRSLRVLIPAAASLSLICGCPMPTPNDNSNANSNGNSNANTNGNSNSNANDNSNSITLTAAQKAEVEVSAENLGDLAAFSSLYAALANPSLDFSSLSQIASFGDCPTISYVSSESSAAFLLEFGTGCESDALNGMMVSGNTGFSYNRTTRSAMITFDNLMIGDSTSVTGSATVTIRGNSSMGVTVSGQFDILVGGKMISGEIVLLLSADGSVQINSDSLSFNDGSGAEEIALNDVVINGTANNTLLPESGNMTYTDADNRTVIVTFSEATIQDGTVEVSVGTLGTATYELGS
ncbi:MAG: hypothetical protein AB7N71_14440 [Phycisphaerae bacterium]